MTPHSVRVESSNRTCDWILVVAEMNCFILICCRLAYWTLSKMSSRTRQGWDAKLLTTMCSAIGYLHQTIESGHSCHEKVKKIKRKVWHKARRLYMLGPNEPAHGRTSCLCERTMAPRKTAIALTDYSDSLTNGERRCYLERILAIPKLVDGRQVRRSARLARMGQFNMKGIGKREVRSACGYTDNLVIIPHQPNHSICLYK